MVVDLFIWPCLWVCCEIQLGVFWGSRGWIWTPIEMFTFKQMESESGTQRFLQEYEQLVNAAKILDNYSYTDMRCLVWSRHMVETSTGTKKVKSVKTGCEFAAPSVIELWEYIWCHVCWMMALPSWPFILEIWGRRANAAWLWYSQPRVVGTLGMGKPGRTEEKSLTIPLRGFICWNICKLWQSYCIFKLCDLVSFQRSSWWAPKLPYYGFRNAMVLSSKMGFTKLHISWSNHLMPQMTFNVCNRNGAWC